MTEPADIVARILSENGAIHPDRAPKGLAYGLVVVGVEDELWKLEHVRLAEYFQEHPRAPALERSRQVLWTRTQTYLGVKWLERGRPPLREDADVDRAWDRLDEVWLKNRAGLRLGEFPGALKKYRAAVLGYIGKDPR